MDTTKLSINTIEGIGEIRKADFNMAGIHYVCDLLLTPPSILSATTHLSVVSIEKWRTAALLLELDCMNAQWAEALVRNGVFDLEQIGHLSLDELNVLFAKAVQDHLITEVPDMETLSTMKVEATRHHYSSQVQGLVVDESGSPIEGVHISCGHRDAESNGKGFWKITGLSFSDRPSVFARKEGYTTQYLAHAPLDIDVWSTAMLTLQLIQGASGPLSWDEYKGDKLPSLVSFKAKQIILGVEDVRPRDIMKVTEIYKNGDIKLMSIFRSMTDDQLNIHCYRISPELFTEDPVPGSYWRKRRGRLEPLGLGDESVLMLKKLHNAPPPVIDPSAPWTHILESYTTPS